MTEPSSRRTVFVDAAPLSERRLTGIGRYAARLSLALKALPECDLRFFADDVEIVPTPSLDWSRDQDLAQWAKTVWRGTRKPLRTEDFAADSLGLYCCRRPLSRRFSFEISILHDFTPLIVPFTHKQTTIREFQQFFARDLLTSDAAIAVSKATKADAHRLCDFPPERIAVAPSGPSLCIDRHLHQGPVTRRPEVGLVVSTLEPRKNPGFLLDWFMTTDALPGGAELLWVGAQGRLGSTRRLRKYSRVNRRGRRARFLGKVADAELCRLYQTAGWTAYPSLYEGFGFPVLDSLRHGAPVLTCNHSALGEFDLPGVHFFDPYDADSVDSAWQSLEASESEVPSSFALDERYHWEGVARVVLGLSEDCVPRTDFSISAA